MEDFECGWVGIEVNSPEPALQVDLVADVVYFVCMSDAVEEHKLEPSGLY